MNDVPGNPSSQSEPEAEVDAVGVAMAPAVAEASSSVQDVAASASMTEGMALGLRRRFGFASIAFLALTAVFMATSVILSALRGPQGPWRGEYFDNEEFEGDPTIQYSRKIEFDYQKDAPFRGMPKDHWSVIWTTCLVVKQETEIRLRLTSDDGSRLYVNDDLVVDNWGLHASRTRSGKVTLDEGVHHLRLDYYEAKHGAIVKLLTAFDDETEHTTLPPQRLLQPGDNPDAPCGE